MFSDENEKCFLSFAYFNPTNITPGVICKKITKTEYFVEGISQCPESGETALVDREGNFCYFSSNVS